MAYIQGNDIRVSVGETVIGGQQNCSVNRETETGDTTTKDSGVWSEEEAVGLSWSVDCDGLIVVDDTALLALKSAWKKLEKVTIKIGTPERYETGEAVIESLSENSPQKEKCTYSVSFKGVGELKDSDDEESRVGKAKVGEGKTEK